MDLLSSQPYVVPARGEGWQVGQLWRQTTGDATITEGNIRALAAWPGGITGAGWWRWSLSGDMRV